MKSVLALLALILTATVTGCGGTSDTPKNGSTTAAKKADTFDIAGTVVVNAISNGRPGAPCYPDEATAERPARPGATKSGVQVGAEVTVTDASGQVVGLGKVLIGEYTTSDYDVSSYCTMPFQVTGVPTGDEFYGMAVASLPMKHYKRSEVDRKITLTAPNY